MAAICRALSACRCATFLTSGLPTFALPRCRFSTSALRCSGDRTYADALALLERLKSNREVVSAISSTSRDMNLDAMPEMLAWMRKAGYDIQDFVKNGLKCIHVAGTKGKGSVCVMVENILLQYRMQGAGISLGKVGLYTSPHLVHVRERIRLDGSPISEPLFTKYFFELWDKFSDAGTLELNANSLSPETKPAYFRYLTILAFHTFIREGVETAIVECGIGGEYDSTNILPAEAITATAITALGIDHAGMLGETIEDIAWHKAGIMKTGVAAYTAQQVPEAQAVLDSRAAEKGVELSAVNRLPSLDGEDTKLGLDGDIQKDNASLSVTLTASHLRNLGITDGVPQPEALATSGDPLPDKFITGLETARWPGRCQYIKDGNTEWLLDGAHTKESLEATGTWFANKFFEAMHSPRKPTATMLIFNQQDAARSASRLLLALMASIFHGSFKPKDPKDTRNITPFSEISSWKSHKAFTYAAFCTNEPFKPAVEGRIDTRLQQALARIYSSADGNQLWMVYESIEEAVDLAHKVSEGKERVLVLVTGSLHLVGGVLKALEKKGVDTSAGPAHMGG